jgi:tryptophanyl-tRNA synthetase
VKIVHLPFTSHSPALTLPITMLSPYHHARRKLLSIPFPLFMTSTSRVQPHHARHNSSSSPSSSTPPPQPKVIFSGIQPTGTPHLGNYLGALRSWVTLQNTTDASTKLLFSIVDLHAITMPQGAVRLREWKRECLACLLALGLGEEGGGTIFMQSQVSGWKWGGKEGGDGLINGWEVGSSSCGTHVDFELYG